MRAPCETRRRDSSSACGGIASDERRAGPGQVIVGDPVGQLDHVARQERLGVEDLEEVAELESRRRAPRPRR